MAAAIEATTNAEEAAAVEVVVTEVRRVQLVRVAEQVNRDCRHFLQAQVFRA